MSKLMGFLLGFLLLVALAVGTLPAGDVFATPGGETPIAEPTLPPTSTPTPWYWLWAPFAFGGSTPTATPEPLPTLEVIAAADVQGDPYACWDKPDLRVGEWNPSDNRIALVMIGCLDQNLVLPLSALTTEEGASRPARWTYWLALRLPDGSLVFASMLKPNGWGYQHLHRVGVVLPDGTKFRLDHLGHTQHRRDPGKPTLRILEGDSYHFDSEELLAGMSIGNAFVQGITTHYPDGRHFPGFSLQIGTIQFVLVKVTEPDPALINGQVRVLAWTGTELVSLDGVFKHLLLGQPVPTPAQYVWGVVDGYPEDATATSMQDLDPLILELFGEEWAEEAAVGGEEAPQPDE